MTKFYNKSSEKEKRRSLRQNTTNAEMLVWSKLKGKQVASCKFRRQYSVGAFVIDFYCPELKLAIEIDGETHFQDGAEAYDQARQQFIEKFGIQFLRFTNQQVYENLEGVIEVIAQMVQSLRSQTPPPTDSPLGKERTPPLTAPLLGKERTPPPTAPPLGKERTPPPTAPPLGKERTPPPTAPPLGKERTPPPTAPPLTKGRLGGVDSTYEE